MKTLSLDGFVFESSTALEKLYDAIVKCRRCHLSNSRINAVPGEGSSDADIMFIGEAPGRDEDEEGRPFVGRAGKFLDELLRESELEDLMRRDFRRIREMRVK